jgi:hypothetical protein
MYTAINSKVKVDCFPSVYDKIILSCAGWKAEGWDAVRPVLTLLYPVQGGRLESGMLYTLY